MGAYDIPTFEWGPASSPIIWNDLVIVQCDTQADSFLLALDAATGETVWKTDRDELPSWGTPTVASTPGGPELVTNASNFVRGYDPRTGKELWRLGRSSKITAPTPIFADGLFVVASGRAPERPIFVVQARRARRSYAARRRDEQRGGCVEQDRPRLVHADAAHLQRHALRARQQRRLRCLQSARPAKRSIGSGCRTVGSGFSASPVAADGKIYLSNEDGDMLVVAAGPTFKHIATNSMGELLMATPALSEGVMYVRSAKHLFAIGRKP